MLLEDVQSDCNTKWSRWTRAWLPSRWGMPLPLSASTSPSIVLHRLSHPLSIYLACVSIMALFFLAELLPILLTLTPLNAPALGTWRSQSLKRLQHHHHHHHHH